MYETRGMREQGGDQKRENSSDADSTLDVGVGRGQGVRLLVRRRVAPLDVVNVHHLVGLDVDVDLLGL